MIESRPYKDPCLITAQVLSVIGLSLSFFWWWGWWISLGLALPAMIMLQTVCCCAMNKCGLITAGVFSIIGGVAEILVFIFYLRDEGEEITGVLGVIGGIMILVTGTLVFVFACGKRYDAAVARMREENDQSDHQPAVRVGVRVTPTETKQSSDLLKDDEIDIEAQQQKSSSFDEIASC